MNGTWIGWDGTVVHWEKTVGLAWIGMDWSISDPHIDTVNVTTQKSNAPCASSSLETGTTKAPKSNQVGGHRS